MKSLKYGLLVVAAIAGVSLCAALAEPNKAAKAGSEATKISGEVIDSYCYIKMGAKGPGHAECAANCGKGGIPLALLEDGSDKVIWLAANKDMQGANEMLIPFAGKKVALTGHWYERGGGKIFAIDKIEPK